MTLEEKVGQLIQIADIDTTTGPVKKLNLSSEMLFHVGSILNVVGSEKIRKIQKGMYYE